MNQAIADKVCGVRPNWSQVLADIREVEAEEAARDEAEWDAYADALTDAYYASIAAADPRIVALNAALAKLEAEGVREQINAKIINVGGAKWMVA